MNSKCFAERSRSGFLPGILGVLLIINSFAYVIPSFTSFLLPQCRNVLSRITMLAFLGEAAIGLWLLIKGARDRTLTEPAAAVGPLVQQAREER